MPIQQILSNIIKSDECDFIRTLFDELDYKHIRGGEKVVVYGAGSAGGEMYDVLSLHGVEIECFCDKNADLVGGELKGRPIISTKTLCENYKERLVVIGVQKYKKEILEFLRNSGFKRVSAIKNDEQFYYYLQFPRWKNSVEKIIQDEALIAKAYNLMADQKSKDIFIKRLSILASYADYASYKDYCKLSQYPSTLPEERKVFAANFESEMYFNNELIKLKDGDSLVDCGAFNGDSLLQWKMKMQKK